MLNVFLQVRVKDTLNAVVIVYVFESEENVTVFLVGDFVTTSHQYNCINVRHDLDLMEGPVNVLVGTDDP